MALAPDPPLLTTLVNDLIIINIDLIIVEISEVKITDHMKKEENTDTGQTYIMSSFAILAVEHREEIGSSSSGGSWFICFITCKSII